MTTVRVLSSLTAWLLVSTALWLSDAQPSVIALAGIVAVVAVFALVVFDLGTAWQPIRWRRPPDSEAPGGPHAERIPRPLRDVDVAVRSHPDEMRPRLAALVEQRLLSRHGIDRRTAPAMADDVLTPALRELVTRPTGRIRGTMELKALIDEIEAL